MPNPKDTDITARKAALDILNTLDQGRDLLDTAMESVSGQPSAGFSPPDRKLVNAIVFGVLRWRRRIDWIIGQYAAIPEKKISPEIMNILRIALFQIFFLDRVPDYAVVNTAVEMAKRLVSVKSSRFVNGVLRNLLRNRPFDLATVLPEDPLMALAVSQSFPDWLIRRWVDRFGISETGRLCEAMNQIPPVTVRANTLQTNRESLQEMLAAACDTLHPTRYSPVGISFHGPHLSIDQLPPFRKGWFQVQDEAAQLVSNLLSPRPGETVLDACAGMGGKTGHIAQLMENIGTLLAVDKDREKLARLDAEMQRLGIRIVKSRPMDLGTPDWQNLPTGFDRILLDAPCSGTGVIRRNPDIKWATDKKDLSRFANRQLLYLQTLAPYVAISGILVYAVCSMEPEENEAVIEKFLKMHPEFVKLTNTSELIGNMAEFIDAAGYFRSFPHIHQMDGFFAVRLKRGG